MHLVDITMFYAPEGGGVSTYINAKARWLAQREQVRHSILSPGVPAGAGYAWPRHASPSLLRLPGVRLPGLNGYRIPWTVRGPARSIEALQPDLIEAGDAAHAAWAALRVRRRCHVPAIAFYHSDLPRLVQARLGKGAAAAARRYLAHLYGQFDLVLAPSRCMVDQLAAMGVAGAVHQPLGIDTSIFTPQRRIATLRAQLGIGAQTRLLVYAGRFTPEKRLPLLLQAVRALGSRYHLLLVGGGSGAVTDALAGCSQASFLPFVRDQATLARLLASCDVLVHPGDCETFGLIVLEAMACGLPVVGTSSGGVAELVDHASGILVPPNSAPALCAAIDAIYARGLPPLAQAAVQRARLYDWNRIMPQLMQRYAGLLASRERDALEVGPICATE